MKKTMEKFANWFIEHDKHIMEEIGRASCRERV